MAVLEGIPPMERGETEKQLPANWSLVLEVGKNLQMEDPETYQDWARSMRAGMDGHCVPMEGESIEGWRTVYSRWTPEDFELLLIAIGEVETE